MASYTLDQVRGFVAVAEEGHFGRAAERLRMTQPPLSRQIQKLERAIGVELFTRTSRAVVLTAAGLAFLDGARRLLDLADAARTTARRVAEGTQGSIRLGFTVLSALTVIGPWMTAAHERLPGVDVVLVEMVTDAQVDALEAGRLDVGLVRGRPRSATLSAELVHAEPLVLAAPRDHPLALLDRPLTLRDIGEFGLVMHSPTGARYLHALVDSEFQRVGVDPNYMQYTNQTHTLLALVDAEVGVGLVPLAATTLQLRNVVYRDIADVDPLGSELYRAWATANDNPAMHAFLRSIPASLTTP